MQKNTRLAILLICIVLFFTITPWLVLYSLGYQIDFKNQKIMATGGVYVRADPSGFDVLVDSTTSQKSGFFSNSVFIQNLLPQIHSVMVHKDGYIDYQKNIKVDENEVTKIENITLLKNNITFSKTDIALAKNIFTKPVLPVIDSAIDLQIKKILNQKTYKAFDNNFGLFVQDNKKNLYLYNKNEKSLDIFLTGVNDVKVSLDGQNIFYATDNSIYLDHSNYEYNQNLGPEPRKILLNKFSEKLSDIFWLNNNYLIMRASDKIKVSEIDNRGNINIIDLVLPKDFTLTSKSQIYFNSQDKKLYILSGQNLIASDRLLP